MAPPLGVPDSVTAQMVAMYEAAAEDINKMAGRAFAQLAETPDLASARFRLARAAELERQIVERLRRLNVAIPGVISEATRQSIESAIAFGERELADLGLDPKNAQPGVAGSIGFALVDEDAVRVIAEDTAARAVESMQTSLVRGAADHGRRAGSVFRSLSESAANVGGSAEREVNRAIARGLITGDPIIADRAVRDLFRDPNAVEGVRKLGNKIIEVGNASMTVRAYASTVVRTRTREATETARHGRLGLSGISLVQITGRVSKNFCTAFIGLVCSLSGEQTVDGVTYPALSSLPNGGAPFHPNCSKSTAAYVPELVSAGRVAMHEKASIEYRARVRTGRLLADVRN
ncbi:MAG: hypothetical protein KJZ65_06670 [Phycisphaerales bacterium]|nr:hypothetical protein [Phycisphaerales bacterium]